MSTVKVNTLTGTTTAGSIAVTGEGNSTTTNLQQGLCKAWVQFDGDATDAAARDSNNVGSMTDHSTGTYSVNFTNNMANDDYAFAMAANNDDTGTGMVTGDSGHQTVVAVGSLKFSFTGASSNSVTDTIIGSAMIIGDLA
jgi:hypothetical protein|tara:strand:- start:60 stop:479 length:420 start_codon:yes stop_codon:yes gene_type:complete